MLNAIFSDFDPGPPPLLLVRQKNARDVYKERRITLSPVWLTVLDEYLQQYQPSGPIFNCTARNLEYVLEDIGYAAGLNRKLSFEMLRWSCAVRDFRAGMDPDHIREKLGLSRISWVETYAKIQMLAQGASHAVDLVSDDDINSADQ